MKRLKVGFKICSRFFGVLSSIWVKAGSPGYEVNRTVRPLPRYGPLCVFDNRPDAEMNVLPGEIIFRCLYVESLEDRVWTPWSEALVENLFTGTVLAAEVTLIGPGKKQHEALPWF